MSAVLAERAPRPRAATGTAPVPPAWAAEVALIIEQLGVQSFRAAVIDLARMATLKAWTVGEKDHPLEAATAADGPVDSAFPGAAASLAELADVAGEVEGHTALTRLSPRRCLFVWRMDLEHAMVVEARYREAPMLVGEIDKSLIRLLCQIGLGGAEADKPAGAGGKSASGQGASGKSASARTDRSSSARKEVKTSRHHARRASASHPWMVWSGRSLLLMGAVASGWLLLAGLPAVHGQAEALGAQNLRLQTLAEESMARNLAPVLAAGETEALEAALSGLAKRGYLQAAAVSNVKDRVVATHGPTLGLKVGALAIAPPDARGLDLSQGSQRIGRLWLIGGPPEVATPTTARLVSTTWLAVLAFGLGSALLAGQRWMRRHRL